MDWIKLLKCPNCGHDIKLTSKCWICGNGHQGRIDFAGILHFTEEDFYYREVPRTFFKDVISAKSLENVRQASLEAIRKLSPAERDRMTNYALDPRRGGVAILGRCVQGNTVLDFGSGWGNLTAACSKLGAQVISVDMTYESLLFGKAQNDGDRILYIKSGRHQRLPFKDGAFDTVFLNGVLEWIPEGYRLNENPEDLQVAYLKEFKRVLKKDGTIVIGIENRHSFAYILGQKEDHTGLRFAALLPRVLANIYSKIIRKRPYRTYTYTKSGYKKLLSKSGFINPNFYVPFTRYRYWKKIVPMEELKKAELTKVSNFKNITKCLAAFIFQLIQRSGNLSHLVQDFYIIANTGNTDLKTRQSTLVSILSEEGDTRDKICAVNASSTQSLFFSSDGWFYKVPLTLRSEKRLRAEITAMNELKDTYLQEYIVPEFYWRDNPGRGVFTRIDGRPANLNSDREIITEILKIMSSRDTIIPLKATNAFSRWNAAVKENRLPDWIEISIVMDILENSGDNLVSAGIVHGDFVPQNIIIQPDNKIKIIDWDRYEKISPRFLDQRLVLESEEIEGTEIENHKDKHYVSKPIERVLLILDRIEKDISAYVDPIYIPSRWHNLKRKQWEKALTYLNR